MSALFDRIAVWSAVTFPASTLESTYTHLRREVEELGRDPGNAEELADVLHLLVQLARLGNVDLEIATERKFAINQRRAWQVADEQGVVEHVRD